jgi:hypothetical protein
MRRSLSLAVVLLLPILLLVSHPASAQKAKDKMKEKEKDEPLPKNTEKTIKAGTLVGRVAAIEEDKRRIRLSVSYPVAVLDQGQVQAAANAQQQILQAQITLRMARDQNGIAQALQQLAQAQAQLAQAQAQLYRVEVRTKDDVYIKPTDDVAVRTARPKEDFDDKGKIKKYTKAELKELRGDGKLPGYKADYSDLAVDQYVQVTLIRKKGAPAPPPAKKGKKDADVLGDVIADTSQLASVILILRQPPTPGQ